MAPAFAYPAAAHASPPSVGVTTPPRCDAVWANVQPWLGVRGRPDTTRQGALGLYSALILVSGWDFYCDFCRNLLEFKVIKLEFNQRLRLAVDLRIKRERKPSVGASQMESSSHSRKKGKNIVNPRTSTKL